MHEEQQRHHHRCDVSRRLSHLRDAAHLRVPNTLAASHTCLVWRCLQPHKCDAIVRAFNESAFVKHGSPALHVTLASVLLISACAGRPANPMAVAQIGDERRSCDALISEMSQIDANIAAKLPETQKTGKNVALGAAGLLLIVPWFFMDFTESEKIEVEAMRNRYTRLNSIAADKDCGAAPSTNVEAMGKAIDATKAQQKTK